MALNLALQAYKDLPRATLSKLAVRGFGTAFIESAGSFSERLRFEHNVSARQMRFLMNHQLHEYCDDVEPYGAHPDSPRGAASAYVRRLSELTAQPQARRLGLGSVSPVVAVFGTMRKEAAWCPLCIKASAFGERENYIPLIWSIGCMEVCSRHKIVLNTNCHACGRGCTIAYRLEMRFPFQRCVKCDTALFQKRNGRSMELKPASASQLYVAREVEEFVLKLHTELWDAELHAPDFRRVLDAAKANAGCGGYVDFLRMANISKGTASRLLTGQRCSLEVYVRIAAAARVGLTGLFAPEMWQIRNLESDVLWARAGAQRRRNADDWGALTKLAESELSRVMPCSFNAFCRRHKADAAHLRNKMSDLASRLDRAHKSAVGRERQRAAAVLADKLIESPRFPWRPVGLSQATTAACSARCR